MHKNSSKIKSDRQPARKSHFWLVKEVAPAAKNRFVLRRGCAIGDRRAVLAFGYLAAASPPLIGGTVS